MASASEVTVNVKDSGTDSVTQRFLNLEIPANKIVLRTDKTVTVNKINGRTLKRPLTVLSDKDLSLSKGILINSLVINVLSDTTSLKLLALG